MIWWWNNNVISVFAADNNHLIFMLSCAAVLTATFSFITVIACRPCHHGRSQVKNIWLEECEKKLILIFSCPIVKSNKSSKTCHFLCWEQHNNAHHTKIHIQLNLSINGLIFLLKYLWFFFMYQVQEITTRWLCILSRVIRVYLRPSIYISM